MFKKTLMATALAALASTALPACAAGSDLQQIQKEISALKASYDARIAELEARLKTAEHKAEAAEAKAASADATASRADTQAQQAVAQASTPAPAPAQAANAFNPAVSLILSGTYGSFTHDPDDYAITGFVPGGEIGPGKRGFSLAESELGVYASVDPWFYGGLNLALTPEDEAEVEEAFIQTTSLPHGLTLKAGRFFSSIGYLNAQHAHTWDFVDAPLAYQAFLGGQYGDDGVQLKWVAPTELFLELGAELGRGRAFPGSDTGRNGAGAQTAFAHLGGDVGSSHSWRAGLSYLHTRPQDREYDSSDNFGDEVTNAFSGSSHLWLADAVWKWAPNGDATRTNFKLQGEYFRRRESGDLTYAVDLADNTDRYTSSQSGWYLQGIYQFMPAWRVGARYDRLDAGNTHFGSNAEALAGDGYDPSRISLMVDWAPSEFSRVRLQLARDKAQQDAADNQLMLQYQMSLGAHGAHSY